MRTAKKSNPTEDTKLDSVALDPKVLVRIATTLKAHYDTVVDAPLPQKIFDLLAQLEKDEQQE